MTQLSFKVIIEKEPEDEEYLGYIPALPGCFSNGVTVKETATNLGEAIRLHVQSLTAHGQPVQQGEGVIRGPKSTAGNRSFHASGQELIEFLRRHGFAQDKRRESYVTLWNDQRKVSVTIPLCDLGRGLAIRILKDAGFTVDEFLNG